MVGLTTLARNGAAYIIGTTVKITNPSVRCVLLEKCANSQAEYLRYANKECSCIEGN